MYTSHSTATVHTPRCPSLARILFTHWSIKKKKKKTVSFLTTGKVRHIPSSALSQHNIIYMHFTELPTLHPINRVDSFITLLVPHWYVQVFTYSSGFTNNMKV